MAMLMQKPEVENDQPETSAATDMKQPNPRVLLAVGVLLTGLSIAIPAAMMAIVLPLNASQYAGETWWPLVFAALALSIGCAIMAILLAGQSWVSEGDTTEAQSAKAPHWVVRNARRLLGFATLVLILTPLMPAIAIPQLPDFEVNIALRGGLIGLGFICIALAVWGVTASDPAITQRWLLRFAAIAPFPVILGNVCMLVLFGLIGVSL